MEISLRYQEEVKRAGMGDIPLGSLLGTQAKEALAELDSLIGLREVKKLLLEVCSFAVVQKKRMEQQLKTVPQSWHMIFKGNPGTGKTTVARILARIFKDIGLLTKGHLVEVERADLVGEYIGHTAQKTREQIKKSLGGILFIDEAYTLAQGGSRDFGREAIATLVKAMEDQRDNFVVILAGYRHEMEQFILSNPGVRSRFPIQVDFPDYAVEELMEIALLMFEQREYVLTAKARWKLKNLLVSRQNQAGSLGGNARYVRNLVEKTMRLQAVRLVKSGTMDKKQLKTIEESDLPLLF